jgi:hypothetical protein
MFVRAVRNTARALAAARLSPTQSSQPSSSHPARVEGLEPRTFLSAAPSPLPDAPAIGPTAIHVGVATDKAATGTPSLSGTVSGVPASGVIGAKTPASVTLILTNTGTRAAAGRVTITLSASTDPALDSSDTPITTVARVLSIRPGKSQKLLLPLRQFPDAVTGPYYILAQVSGPAAASLPGPVVSTGTVFLAPPYVDLTGAFESVPSVVTLHKPEAITLLVVNNGNTPAKGRLEVVFEASASVAGSSATSLGTAIKAVNLKPHSQVRMALSGRVEIAPGAYFIAAEIDPTNVFNDLIPDNNLVTTSNAITFQQ